MQRRHLLTRAHVTLRAELIEGTNRQIKWMVTFAAARTTVLVAAVRLIP